MTPSESVALPMNDRNDPACHLGSNGEFALDRDRPHGIGRENEDDRGGLSDAPNDRSTPTIVTFCSEVVGIEPRFDPTSHEVVRESTDEGSVPPRVTQEHLHHRRPLPHAKISAASRSLWTILLVVSGAVGQGLNRRSRRGPRSRGPDRSPSASRRSRRRPEWRRHGVTSRRAACAMTVEVLDAASVGPRTMPQPASSTATPFSHWSANSGTTNCGRPCDAVPSTVPAPPWETTALARPSRSACGTKRSTRTLGGTAPSVGRVDVWPDGGDGVHVDVAQHREQLAPRERDRRGLRPRRHVHERPVDAERRHPGGRLRARRARSGRIGRTTGESGR